ncbi:hypothetical protein Scep_028236 [Stephania cephalantha]|uniref:Uncharacterized protein n=1 Tax=Stephania cephalantha TaxID=152367 RepID=A0AAP0EHX5_9MAGN
MQLHVSMYQTNNYRSTNQCRNLLARYLRVVFDDVRFCMTTREERTRLEDCGDCFHTLKQILVLNCLYLLFWDS